MIKSITIVLVTLLAVTTVAGQALTSGAPKPVRGLPGRCGKTKGLFENTHDGPLAFNTTGLEGGWRTALGSDHRIGVHGDASTQLFHGCSATRFNVDAQNKSRIVMVTGRTSGFHPWLCEAPQGPEEYSWDGCRRYIYDDSVLLVAGGEEFGNRHHQDKFAYLDNHAEDPDAVWNETLTKVAAGAEAFSQLNWHKMTPEEFAVFREENQGDKEKEINATEAWTKFLGSESSRKLAENLYWADEKKPGPYSESPWKILWAHRYGGLNVDEAYDTLYAHRCVEHHAQTTAEADLRHDRIANSMRAAAKEVKQREGDNEEFQEYLRNMTATISSEHWDLFPEGYLDNETSNATQLEYAQWLLDRENDHDEAVMINKTGFIDLVWFNKLRFFLTSETYTAHDLDYEILAKTDFFESSPFQTAQIFNTIAAHSMTFLPDHQEFTKTHWQFKDNDLCPLGDINSQENLEKYNAIPRKEADRLMNEYNANINEKKNVALRVRAQNDRTKWSSELVKKKTDIRDRQSRKLQEFIQKEEKQKKQEKEEMEEQQKANEADEFDDDDEEQVQTEQVKTEEPVKNEEPVKTDEFKSEEL